MTKSYTMRLYVHYGIIVSLILSLISNGMADTCLFGFEDASEIGDFDLSCEGHRDIWTIKDIPPELDPNSEYGKKALTLTAEQQLGCAESMKQITLDTITKATVKFYAQKSLSSSINLKISVVPALRSCSDKNCGWDITEQLDSYQGEQWFVLDYEFHLPSIQDYSVQIDLYLGQNTQLLIDSITIWDTISDSEQCYEIPRSTTTQATTTTTEVTTTTTTEAQSTTTTTEGSSLSTTTDSTWSTTTESTPNSETATSTTPAVESSTSTSETTTTTVTIERSTHTTESTTITTDMSFQDGNLTTNATTIDNTETTDSGKYTPSTPQDTTTENGPSNSDNPFDKWIPLIVVIALIVIIIITGLLIYLCRHKRK